MLTQNEPVANSVNKSINAGQSLRTKHLSRFNSFLIEKLTE